MFIAIFLLSSLLAVEAFPKGSAPLNVALHKSTDKLNLRLIRRARLRAMKKYFEYLVRKQDVDTAEQEADQADQNDNSKGNTILSNQNNLIYYGQVTIGTPGQTFSVLFDTANADLWVPGLNCTTAACLATTLYDPSTSSTAVGLGTTFTDSNNYGSVTGWVWRVSSLS